jgi:hypothetical protein
MDGENIKKRGRPRKDENSCNTETRTSESNGIGGTERGSTEGIEPSKVLEVDLVKLDLPDGAKKQRGRPKGSNASKKEKETKLNSNDIAPLVSTVFSLVSLKAGEHWSLSDAEAESITKPLCNILDKLNLTEKVSNLSDGAGLVLALIVIVAPRVMISASLKKETKEKIIEKNGGGELGKVRDFKANGNRNTGDSDKRTTESLQNNGNSIKTAVNTTIGYY